MQELKERVESSIVDDEFYNVLMFNDDVTPFEYVIIVLNTLFDYEIDEGFAISMHIHKNGSAIVATLPMKEAYERVAAVEAMNDRYGMLLQTNVEKA